MKKIVPFLLGTIILFFTSSESFAWGKPGCTKFDILCKLTGKGASEERIHKKGSKSIKTSQEGVTISNEGKKLYKGRRLKFYY